MSDEHQSLSTLYRSESAKLYRRFLMFGFLLLMAHLLDLQPQKYSGFGLSVNIKDQRILYGFMSAIVLYEFAMAFYYEMIGHSIWTFDFSKAMKENLSKSIKDQNPTYSDALVSFWANVKTGFFVVILAPFFMVILVVGLLAIVVACFDFYSFGSFVADKYLPKLFHFLDSL